MWLEALDAGAVRLKLWFGVWRAWPTHHDAASRILPQVLKTTESKKD